MREKEGERERERERETSIDEEVENLKLFLRFIHLKGRMTRKGKLEADRESELFRLLIHSSNGCKARAEADGRQQPRIPSVSPAAGRDTGTWAIISRLQDASAGSWI